jgi:L-2-hydroxyglutarate oxidase LhgO
VIEHRVDEAEARAIEPRAKTVGHALFVPSTATADSGQLIAAQQADFIAQGGMLRCGHPYKGHEGDNLILAGPERIQAGTVINCAGLYADRVAKDFGFGNRYVMLPFKGLYLYAATGAEPPRTHVYPVPDLRNPFLGVHLTRTLDGDTKIGPTAIPALWREHYGGLGHFRARELMEVASRELHMLLTNRNNFRKLAWQELRKQSRRHMINDASTLISDLKLMGFQRWGRPGIRAQLVERADNKLVMDFVIEGDGRSTHVLNALSPAWTCAIPSCRKCKHTHLCKFKSLETRK